MEKASYNSGVVSDSRYPADLQAAQARIDAQNGTAQRAYGGVSEGSVQSGSRAAVFQDNVVPTFAHH